MPTIAIDRQVVVEVAARDWPDFHAECRCQVTFLEPPLKSNVAVPSCFEDLGKSGGILPLIFFVQPNEQCGGFVEAPNRPRPFDRRGPQYF